MKIDIFSQNEDVEIIGEVNEIKSGKLQIKEKNLPYFISMLTKIYSNRVGSIVREITSNCFDAHVKAGVTNEPVIIRKYIDDSGQRYIEFVDQGCGISEEAMEEIYASIGESDKRDSNEYFGAFGLGSKSPLSYSSHFYVITKVDGIEYTYLLNESVGEITYDCFVKTECDPSKNGTIIRIPIKKEDEYEFTNEIKSQLRYFTDVYVVGFDVKNDYSIKKYNTFQIRTDMFNDESQQRLHVCSGKVYYPINWDVLNETPILFNAALTFNIGELDVIFNREELEYTAKTKKALIDKINAFKEEINSLVFNDSFYNKDNLYEYYKASTLLSEDSKVNFTFLDKEFIFNKSSLPFLGKINYKYKFEDFKLSITTGSIRQVIKSSITSILKRSNGGLMISNNAFKYFSNSNHKQFLYQRYNNNKYNLAYVVNHQPILTNHKRFLIDNYVDAVFNINSKLMKKLIYRALINKKNTAALSSISKQELLLKLFNVFVKDFVASKYNNVYDLNIPDDYGKKPRKSVQKDKDSILIYLTGERKEIFSPDELGETRLFLFSTTENAKNLRQLYSLFDGLHGFEYFHCSKKYVDKFKNISNIFFYDDIIKEKENSNFFKHVKVKDFVDNFIQSKGIKAFNELLNKENITFDFKYSSISLNRLKEQAKNYPNLLDFQSILSKIEEKSKNENLVQKRPLIDLTNYLSLSFINKNVNSFLLKEKKKIDNVKLINQFVDDFEIELTYIDDYEWRDDMNIKALDKNLKIKESLLNNYKNKF